MGRKVALIIDPDTGFQLYGGLKPIEKIVTNLEKMADYYEKITNFTPSSDYFLRQFRVEIAFLENAGGRAGHGNYGVCIGPDFLKQTYDRVIAGEQMLHQIFYYETFRNFVDPNVFTPAFDYACRSDPMCYGWINQGFVNVFGCLVCKDISLEFLYAGDQDRSGFRRNMENNYLGTYIERGETWNSCLGTQGLCPWDQYASIDGIWSGIISQLYDMCGENPFIIRLFRLIPLMAERRGGVNYERSDHQSARDNLFIAVSNASIKASTQEILDYFRKLHISISKDASTWSNFNQSKMEGLMKY